MNQILHEGDPAQKRFRLIVALGHPTLSAYETSILARFAAWTSDEDWRVLVRLVRRARSDGFSTGYAAGKHDAAEGGAE